MFEYTISGKPSITATRREVPIPSPSPHDILIKVHATSSNPKDWKASASHDPSSGINQGDDIAGIVSAVGSEVYEFAPGDRVAAFHRMFTPHGSYAEYAIAPASTTFKLPAHIEFEEAATMPLASMTAALALYQHLDLPVPWATTGSAQNTPVLIYGGASTVGAFALKLAKLSGLGPIITVAGNGIDFVKSLDAATHIIDYRKGNVVEDVLAALDVKPLLHAFDAISNKSSWKHILAVFTDERNGGGKGTAHINMVDPPSSNPFPTSPEGPADWGFPPSVRFSRTFVSSAYGKAHMYRNEEEAKKDGDFAYVFYRYLGRLLAEGRFKGHPYEVMPGGLESVGEGVKRLFENKVSAKKLVYRIADTPGAGKEK
ncbi:putative zinc binding dehydrogenase [Paraphoma chrysanthemicola]|uniref:Zinc binding dehydrogenase n=1 Tax=Paraphoma chrysanthemicola TaxID=798071 RepID=A0A8K0QXX7_9PLEO|nr:putative zinc binding dehydrogenase [Paraphoma chrysanthemicola]